MSKVITDFPDLAQRFVEFQRLSKELKVKRKIKIPPEPTSDKTRDLYHHLGHYINIIHLKLVHQLHLLSVGIKAENPEVMATVRSCIETIGALAYMVQEIEKKRQQPEAIWEMLNIATMGENKKTMSKQTVFTHAPQTYHSADYVRAVNDILDNELKKNGSKNGAYILERYDFFSEYTHPNYLAMEAYWEVKSGKLKYNKKISCMRKDNLADILFTITPLILVYVMVLRRAEKIESDFKKLMGA
ncbi:hypothetical protein C5B42_00675 [Candidatus Cerribacteria bacterium 'Amazon FNV 2010 28 9']|uniref:Uncharacterized protein n=1 Tax=Candidatus Cerribacteria bacterium 'Amazon FNV 2010 28 9' TaxID=2081795 RepID=A0A317JRD4_9BACT|nr:MAG: hypothetical protein C5B42_00675 [Candidatus Cerribacteria bacterium 'Amazon FNV 2010 28 9']